MCGRSQRRAVCAEVTYEKAVASVCGQCDQHQSPQELTSHLFGACLLRPLIIPQEFRMLLTVPIFPTEERGFGTGAGMGNTNCRVCLICPAGRGTPNLVS